MHVWTAVAYCMSTYRRCIVSLISGLALLCVCIASIAGVEHELSQQGSTLNEAENLKPFHLKPFKATYNGYRKGKKIGTAELSLLQLNTLEYQLKYQSQASWLFLSDKRTEVSVFEVSGSGEYQSLLYDYKRTGSGKNQKTSLKFSQKDKTITINEKNQIDHLHQIDNQLIRLDLAKQLSQGKTKVDYNYLNTRGKPRTLSVEVIQEEQLNTPYGLISTIKVAVHRPNKDRQSFLWFSPDLNYTLVRLLQFENGKEQGDLKLSGFEFLE